MKRRHSGRPKPRGGEYIALYRAAARLTPEQSRALARIRAAAILGADRATLVQMTAEAFGDPR